MTSTLATSTNQNHLQLDHFAKDVQDIIVKAQTLADELHHEQIQPLHLFSIAMKNDSVFKATKAMKMDLSVIVGKIDLALSEIKPSRKDEESWFSGVSQRMFTALERDSSTSDLVQIEKFFGTLISKSYKDNHNIIVSMGAKPEDLIAQIALARKSSFSQLSIAQLLDMEKEIGKRVIGQKDAINAISRTVRRGAVGLNSKTKPLASLLFLGSSGCGKTEVAKALTQFLYGDEKKLVRIDCAEYGQKHMVARLLGSPSGYQGSEDGGFLTNAVLKNPHCVILIDELEKAASELFDVFLGLLDDARMTSGKGELVDFSQCIIIMTSNIGSRKILTHTKESDQNEEGRMALREMLLQEVMQFLRPEFINRVDETIIFNPLSRMEIGQIVDIQLRALSNLLGEKEMKIAFDEQARNAISELGYDPMFGSRPLKRVITKFLCDPIAEKIIAGAYKSGSQINVGYDGLQFQMN